MAENEGGIVYTVDMETAPLVSSGAKANQVLDGFENSVNSVNSSLKKMDTQLTSTASAVNTASNSAGKLRGTVQQAGYQIQDFVVQVQGGQSALVAFSQQGSQLAGAFGPGGAVIGAILAISTVIAGVLIKSLGDGASEMDKLKAAAEELNKVVVFSQSGIAALSNDFAMLARTNATLAAAMRDNAIQKYELAVKDASKAITQVISDQNQWWRSLGSDGAANIKLAGDSLSLLGITTDNFSAAMKQATSAGSVFQAQTDTIGSTVGMLASKFDISDQSAYSLLKQLTALSANPSPEKLNALITSLNGMKSSTDSGQQAIIAFSGQLIAAGQSIEETKNAVSQLTKGLEDLKTQAQAQNFKSLSDALETQRIKLTKGDLAAKQYAISLQDLTDEQKAILKAAAATNEGLDEAQKAQKKSQQEAEAASKRNAAAQDAISQKLEQLRQKSDLAGASTGELSRQQAILTAEQSLGKSATQAQIDQAGQYAAKAYDNAAALRAQTKAEQDRKKAVTDYDSIKAKGAPVKTLDDENAKQMAALTAYEKIYPAKIAEVEATRAAIEKQYRDQRIAAMWTEWEQQNTINGLLGNAFDGLANSGTNALTGLLNGTQSLGEALANIGTSVESSIIKTFVDMGVEWVKSAVTGAAAQNAAIASTTAASVAGTATTTAASTAAAGTTLASWLPAALVASIGSFGAAAVVGGSALLAAFGLIAGLSGKRKNGGPVSAGSMYQVGEGGAPEIYQASSGKQFMIPGDNGKVISNKDIGGGSSSSSAPTVNVHNYNGSTIDTRSSANSDGSMNIDIIVADITEGGPISQAITRHTTASRRTQ